MIVLTPLIKQKLLEENGTKQQEVLLILSGNRKYFITDDSID